MYKVSLVFWMLFAAFWGGGDKQQQHTNAADRRRSPSGAATGDPTPTKNPTHFPFGWDASIPPSLQQIIIRGCAARVCGHACVRRAHKHTQFVRACARGARVWACVRATRAHSHTHNHTTHNTQHTQHNTHESQPASQAGCQPASQPASQEPASWPASQPAGLSAIAAPARPTPAELAPGGGGDCLRMEPKGSKIIKKHCTRRKNPNHEILRRGARSKCVRNGENS